MAKRILNRREMRADFDAAESRSKEEEETEEDEEGKDDEDEDEEDEEEGAEDEEPGEEGEAEDEELGDDEEAPRKKKKVVKAKAPAKPRARSRAAKVVRMRIVWGVFDNSNKCVATYEYPRRKEAEEHAARLTTGPGKTHFIQPVKEPIEEKKEDKK